MPRIIDYTCGKTFNYQREISTAQYVEYLQLLCFFLAFALNTYIIFCYYFKRYNEPLKSHQFFVILVSLQVLIITSLEFAYFISIATSLADVISLNDPVVWSHRLDVPASTWFLAAYRSDLGQKHNGHDESFLFFCF